jgi:hypothetical protein
MAAGLVNILWSKAVLITAKACGKSFILRGLGITMHGIQIGATRNQMSLQCIEQGLVMLGNECKARNTGNNGNAFEHRLSLNETWNSHFLEQL